MEAVLSEWFGDLGDDSVPAPEKRKRWFNGGAAFDSLLRERFGETLEAARRGELEHWAKSPRGALALAIVLDQFSRNIYRNQATMYAADELAQRVALEAIERGDDRQLLPMQRLFLYMPLMHAEDREHQTRCVSLFEDLCQEGEGPESKLLESNLDYARRHSDIVQRFGRFPHRNRVLGRETSPEEEEFLKRPGSSF